MAFAPVPIQLILAYTAPVVSVLVEPYLSVFRRLIPPAGGLDFSPIKGPEGNIEYLLCLKKGGLSGMEVNISETEKIVFSAFESLQ